MSLQANLVWIAAPGTLVAETTDYHLNHPYVQITVTAPTPTPTPTPGTGTTTTTYNPAISPQTGVYTN